LPGFEPRASKAGSPGLDAASLRADAGSLGTDAASLAGDGTESFDGEATVSGLTGFVPGAVSSDSNTSTA
jgi:hypothetical protein